MTHGARDSAPLFHRFDEVRTDPFVLVLGCLVSTDFVQWQDLNQAS
jgi:hypothetical protein